LSGGLRCLTENNRGPVTDRHMADGVHVIQEMILILKMQRHELASGAANQTRLCYTCLAPFQKVTAV
jgi:hypothetical protein